MSTAPQNPIQKLLDREEVYKVIDGEINYQPPREASVAEWVLYIQDKSQEAGSYVSRHRDPEGSQMSLNAIRVLGAMCVACLEQHGSPPRKTAKQVIGDI